MEFLSVIKGLRRIALSFSLHVQVVYRVMSDNLSSRTVSGTVIVTAPTVALELIDAVIVDSDVELFNPKIEIIYMKPHTIALASTMSEEHAKFLRHSSDNLSTAS